jgi:toxin-antitoxin system PIN domain toxin
MRSVDVNVLVYAFDADSQHHARARQVLEECAVSHEPLGLFPPVLTGFLRVVTDRRILTTPATPTEARSYLMALLEWPQARIADAGSRWWDTFAALVAEHDPRGAEVSDVALAAMALELDRSVIGIGHRHHGSARDLMWLGTSDTRRGEPRDLVLQRVDGEEHRPVVLHGLDSSGPLLASLESRHA